MRLLLDSQVFLWLNNAAVALDDTAMAAIADSANDRFLSVASCWELGIKVASGKLHLPEPISTFIPSALAFLGASLIAIEAEHAFSAAGLPRHHGDPFDRMLVAQAQIEGLALVTRDRQLAVYGIDLILA